MPAPQSDQLAQGIAIILASVTAMAFADAMVKRISSDLTLWQLFVCRSLFAMAPLLWLSQRRRIGLRTASIGWVALRSALLVLTWLAFYASLPFLDLSLAAVAIYSNPVITALLGAWLLRERVQRLQWLGVLFGFAGVALIIKPTGPSFSWALLLPLGGALLYSTAMVLTRSKCQHDSAVALAMNLHIAFILCGVLASAGIAMVDIDATIAERYPFVLGNWAPMQTRDWLLMAFLGALAAGYFLGVARAYQIAPPQIIATFDYAYLISAALWGLVFFAEIPGVTTLFGMLLITAAGLLASRRR